MTGKACRSSSDALIEIPWKWREELVLSHPYGPATNTRRGAVFAEFPR
jgi:hypothetical protein